MRRLLPVSPLHRMPCCVADSDAEWAGRDRAPHGVRHHRPARPRGHELHHSLPQRLRLGAAPACQRRRQFTSFARRLRGFRAPKQRHVPTHIHGIHGFVGRSGLCLQWQRPLNKVSAGNFRFSGISTTLGERAGNQTQLAQIKNISSI
jgi:hypothetical protein